jgi:hypothetical protein
VRAGVGVLFWRGEMHHYLKPLMVFAFLGLAACSTITIRPEGTKTRHTDPTFQKSEDFYFWGLKNEFHVNALAACADKKIVQMQVQDTPKDVFYTIITLGIYSPRSVKIWCE